MNPPIVINKMPMNTLYSFNGLSGNISVNAIIKAIKLEKRTSVAIIHNSILSFLAIIVLLHSLRQINVP